MTFFVRKIPFTCQNFFAENTKTQKKQKAVRKKTKRVGYIIF